MLQISRVSIKRICSPWIGHTNLTMGDCDIIIDDGLDVVFLGHGGFTKWYKTQDAHHIASFVIERHLVPSGTFRESQRPQRFSSYTILMSHIISEPCS